MNSDYESLIDKLIQEARERGEFDPPNTKNKPLRDDTSEIMAGDTAMSNKVLKNGGYAPPFLMKKREIDDKLGEERARLARYAMRRKRLHGEADATRDENPTLATALDDRAEHDWAWAVRKFEEALPKLNKDIELFNLMNKIPNLFKMKVRMEWEIERAESATQSPD
jgi:hypothetical protein